MRILGALVAVILVAAFLTGDTGWLHAVWHHSMTDIRTAWEQVTT